MKQAWLSILPSSLRSRIEGSSKLQGIITNTGWLFLDKIVRVVGSLTIGMWLARYLGPQQYGTLNFAMAFVALFGAMSSLGMNSIVVLSLVKSPGKKDEILASAFFLRIFGGTAAFITILISIHLFRPNDDQVHLLVAILAAGMLFNSFDVIELWFQSQVASKYTIFAKNAAYLLHLAIRVVLILNNASVVAFAFVMLLDLILGAIGLITAYHANNQSMKGWRIQMPIALGLLRDSWPLMLSGFAYMVFMKIDQVMLGQMVGDKEVGLYAAAIRFSEIWYFIPYAIVSSVMPNLTEAKMRSEAEYYEKLQRLFNLLVRISYLVALPIAFISAPLIVLFCGSQYASGGSILAVHIWSAVFVFASVGASPWIINEGLTKLLLFQTFMGASINVVLNYLLIPEYGGMGAAIATVVAQFISVFASNMVFSVSRKLFFMQARALFRLGL